MKNAHNREYDHEGTGLYFDSEDAPEWIQIEIEASEWTKRKLKCSHCKVVLGFFNFHQTENCPPPCGQHRTPPVMIIKSKVDVLGRYPLPEYH